MAYKRQESYKWVKDLLLTLNGINELYMKHGGLEDVFSGGFRKETGRLIKMLDSDKSDKKGIVLEVRLHLANSFPCQEPNFI